MSLTGNPDLSRHKALKNEGFWPDLNSADLLENYRIPSEYAPGIIETGLMMAMIRVNEKLSAVKSAMIDLGFNTLAAYTAANISQINQQDVLKSHYQHAVFCRAKAGLLQQAKTLNRKPNAENMAKESEHTEMYWLDESQISIKGLFDLILPENTTLAKDNAHVVLL